MEGNLYKAAHMTRWLACGTLAVVLACILAGCNGDSNPPEPTPSEAEQESTATPEPTNTPSPTTTPTPARPLVPVPTSGPVGTIRLGMPAPDFGLHFYETRAGESLPQRLSDLLGTPVVLMFWFPGCDPCMTDLQNIGSVYRGLRWGGVRFIGVQTYGFPQEGQEIVDELALSYDFVFDDHGEASRLYGVVHVPMTVVLNADHTVAGWLKGGLSLGGLRDLLESTLGSSLPPPTATPTPTDPGDTIYCEFSGLPERFFQESFVPREQVERVVSAQAWSLTKMHNGISPYSYFGYCRIEYSPEVYGHTMPYGVKLGDFAFPGLNSGHHRWEVMAHEHGHNFFGGTKPFYTDIATPAPFLQESLAVLSAFYTFHDLLENQQEYGIDDATVESLVFDFGNGRAYQEAQFKEYVDQGMKFDIHDILTSQALDFMMITYGEEYGWDKFERLTKAFEEFGVQLDHQSGEVTPVDQSTYIVAALGAAFGRDFRQDFVDLSFPIDDARYLYFLAKMSEHLGPPPPTATPETPVTESERLVSRLSAAFAEDGDLNDFEKAYLRRIGGASTPELALALSSSPLTEDTAVSELEIDILKKIERYHPRLQAAIVSHAPQGAAPFLSGSVLSDQEIEALGALHSVFGIEAFYDAWQLDWLEINEIQAVLRLLQSYDPFSTVYGPTENTDSQDGLIERTFDQFSVGPADSCVYCQGQKYFTSGSPTKDYRSSGYSPEEYLEYSKAVTQDVVVRTRLLHLVHAATVQFRRLSPCDLRDYSKPELLVMAPNSTEFFNPLYDYYSYYGPIAYFINATTFMHSVEVNAQMLAAVAEPRSNRDVSDRLLGGSEENSRLGLLQIHAFWGLARTSPLSVCRRSSQRIHASFRCGSCY